MSLYKYVSVDTLMHILNGSIRFTQAGAFNDPFELLPRVRVPEVPTEIPKRNFQFSVFAPRQLRREKSETAKVPSNDDIARQLRSLLDRVVGFLCLSKNSESLTMWSHYTDQYRGAVVEFDEKHEFFKHSIEVRYENERPEFSLAEILEAECISVADFCSKSVDWSYEKEIRLARSFENCHRVGEDGYDYPVYVMDIPIDSIRSVTMGERMPVQDGKKILEQTKDTNIVINQAAVDHTKFGFRVEQMKFNEPIGRFNWAISPKTAKYFTEGVGSTGKIARYLKDNHPLSDMVNRKV